MSSEAIAAWVGVVIAAVAVIGAFSWWFAKLYSKICSIDDGVISLRSWISDINDGKGLVCVRHETRLDGLDVELENHGRRITTLEQHDSICRRPT